MRWLKSFLSPNSGACQICRLWVIVAIVAMIGGGVTPGFAAACGPNSPGRVLRLGRRAARRLLLSATEPTYPSLAKINYIGGRVQLRATVDCQGRVKEIHVIRGQAFLAAAALSAIRRWVYRPFETQAGPAAFQTNIEVNFTLISPNLRILTLPPQPDKFLARGVRPPQLVSDPRVGGATGQVRLRVLVNKMGHVVDSSLLSGSDEELAEARGIVARWKFRPARWAHLDVPWYADINVPVRKAQSKLPESKLTPPSGVTPP
jgi:TonB family protein